MPGGPPKAKMVIDAPTKKSVDSKLAKDQQKFHAHGHAQSLVRLWSSAGTTPGSTASAEGGAGGEGGEKDEEEVARLKAERERRKEEKAAAKVIS